MDVCCWTPTSFHSVYFLFSSYPIRFLWCGTRSSSHGRENTHTPLNLYSTDPAASGPFTTFPNTLWPAGRATSSFIWLNWASSLLSRTMKGRGSLRRIFLLDLLLFLVAFLCFFFENKIKKHRTWWPLWAPSNLACSMILWFKKSNNTTTNKQQRA